MTPQQIVGLGVRLVAIWLAITSVQYLASIPAALTSASLGDKTTPAYIIGAVYLTSAALLWLFPMWVAHKLIPRTRFQDIVTVQALEAARVGCGLIGLWLFANALPNLVWFLFRLFLFTGNQAAFQSLATEAKLDIAVAAVNLLISLVIVFRATDIARLVVRGPTHEC